MTDNEYTDTLRRTQAEVEDNRAPPFEEVFAVAAARARRQALGRRVAGGVVAAAVIATVVLLLPGGEPDWQFVDPEQFASDTRWVAPSDVLLPERRFDIYEEIPVLIESTETDGGALL
jgi:hypothetical protein